MPWKIVKDGDQECVHKENEDGSVGEVVKCHDTHEEAVAHQRALYANVEAAEAPATLVVLADYTDSARPVEFLRTGTFTDAHGKQVEVTDETLDTLIANFESGAAGQDVPIDVQHKREEAAGWVTRIWRDGSKLFAEVDWNNLGKQLVGDKVFRYLSATIDLSRATLRSISLVNFPAVKGLKPVELSEVYFAENAAPSPQTDEQTPQAAAGDTTVAEVDMAEDIMVPVAPAAPTVPVEAATAMLTEDELKPLRTKIEQEMRSAMLAEYEQLEKQKARMFAELMEQVREERNIAEFAEAATSQGRHALPIKSGDLAQMLTDLPKQYRKPVMDLLNTITGAGTVDFTEHGTANGRATMPLPTDTELALRSFIAGGGNVATFFEANTDLNPKDYDLKEYQNG